MIQVDLLFFLFRFSGKGCVRMPWSSSVSGNRDFLLTAGETCLTHSISALYWSLKTVSGTSSRLSRWLCSALTRIKSTILWQTFWQDGKWEQVLIVAIKRRIEQITINVMKSSRSIKYFLLMYFLVALGPLLLKAEGSEWCQFIFNLLYLHCAGVGQLCPGARCQGVERSRWACTPKWKPLEGRFFCGSKNS